MKRILELRQKRAGLIAAARNILDTAEGEKRELSQEEQNNWDGLMNQVTALGQTIDREERQAAMESDLGQPAYAGARADVGDGQPELRFASRGMQAANEANPEWRDNPEWQRVLQTTSPAYRRGFGAFLRSGRVGAELRALQADADVSGGYLLSPMQFVDQLIKGIDDMVMIRQWATVLSVGNSDSLGVPTLEADPADANWTSELATGSEDSTMSFGRRQLQPKPLAKRIKVSRKLLAKVPNAEGLVRDRLAYKFAITFEKACLTGSGAGQPLGVFTASAQGISTSRDVSTGNTTTEIRTDGLINAKYAIKGQYWPRLRWLFHRDGAKQIAKLKDGNGQYLWRESVRAGEPDRLLNAPLFMSEYAPNTFTTGQYVGIIGDFANYWIADSMAFEIQTLFELYAESNQVGMIGRLESDGQPVLEEAFARVTLG